MQKVGFSQVVVLMLALLPVAGQATGQARSPGGQSRNGTYAYARKKVMFDGVGKKRPIEAMFTVPRNSRPSPAIVFITGAWNASKDGLGEAEALRSLADYLGEHGIAVLQIKQPTGGRSTSDLSSATGATFETDIRAGLNYLKGRPEIDPQRIGLFGQNENGAIATVMATLTHDVSFLILAGTAITEHEPASKQSDAVTTYDLRPILEQVNCPVLVLQGDQDPSLPVRENLTAYRNALLAGKNEHIAIAALPGLNRALETTLGNGQSESEMAPLAMRTLTGWVSRQAPGKGGSDSDVAGGDDEEKITHRKPSNRYGDVPGGVIGQFRYRPEMAWIPPIGGQSRPYGYWYW